MQRLATALAVLVTLGLGIGAGVGAGAGGRAEGVTTIATGTTVITTTIPDVVAPGPPTIRSATATSDGITVLWNAPVDDGGAPVTNYRIYRATDPKATPALLATLGRVDSYADRDVVPGTTYFYAVSAANQAGEGPLSGFALATAQPSLFQPYQATSVGSWPEAVAIGDVNGDGRNDVVMTTSYYFDPVDDFRLFVFLQAPDGTLSPPVSYATAGTYSNRPESVAVGDVTNDGAADVAVAIDGVGVQVFPQLASGTLGPPTMYATTNSNKIRLGQLDDDGRLDVAGVGWGTNTVDVLLNNGHGLSAPVTYAAPHAGYEDLEVGDVTGDGRDDVIVMSGQTYAVPNVSVLEQLPAGGFGPAASYRVAPNTNTQGIGVGDVTGDGRNDVVASYGGNQPSASLAVFAQTPGGVLAAPGSYGSYDIPEPVAVADVDLDGRADVVTLHGGWLRAGVYLQQSDGTLGPESLYPIPYASHYNPHGLAVGDISGDGAPDIVLADYNNGLVVLRNTTRTPSAPDPPELISATPGTSGIALSWSAPPGAVGGYRVYRGTAAGAETLLATVGSVTTFTDAGAVDGRSYYYKVSAVNGVGESARSNEISATAWNVPGAPTLTSAKAVKDAIVLAWSAPASNGGTPVTGYRIYRTANGSGELLATVGTVTTYTDTSGSVGTTYSYTVSAVNDIGEGPRSNALSATAVSLPGTPTLTSAQVGKNGVALGWSAPASNGGTAITGYRIYRGGSSGGETLLASVGNVSTYTDTTAPNGKTSYYQVSAVNAVGESGRSNELSAKRLR